MKQATAFAPGNVSCVFKIVTDPAPEKMHSLGMGFTVREGVTVSVRPDSATNVAFNGRPIDFPAVQTVAESLTDQPVRVTLDTPLPLGCGFGLSGASSLATAYAVDALLGLGRSPRDLAMAAHVAEVRCLSGLGDVCAQFHGGWLVKLREGDPLAAVRTSVPEQPIFYRYFGPIDTRSVIGSAEQKQRINAAADTALAALAILIDAREAAAESYIEASKAFAIASGLLTDPRVRHTIEQVEAAGGHASMVMLGHAVFSTAPFDGATETQMSIRAAEVL